MHLRSSDSEQNVQTGVYDGTEESGIFGSDKISRVFRLSTQPTADPIDLQHSGSGEALNWAIELAR